MARGYHKSADGRRVRVEHGLLMRLLCLLPAQSAPARMMHLRQDLGIDHPTQLARLFDQLRNLYGVTVETKGHRAWINPASWKKAQELGMAYVETEAT